MTHEETLKKFSNDRYACDTTGVIIVKAHSNYSLCSLTIKDDHLNGNNCVMGGAIFTLADYAFGVAANYDGQDTVTLSSTISYQRPSVGPVLLAEAICRKSGRSIAFFDINITDDAGELIASASFTGFRKTQRL